MNPAAFGQHWSFNLHNDPKRLAFVLSRYRFAALMTPRGSSVLELGCSEGIGVPMLMTSAGSYCGVDVDGEAVAAARRNWRGDHVRFIEADFLGKNYGTFEVVVSLDVVEHISPPGENLFFDTIFANLSDEGIGVVGTPNITAAAHASTASKVGHVNLFTAERLVKAMGRGFRNTFLFSMNDEVVHTGFSPMAHFLICLGCFKRRHLSP